MKTMKKIFLTLVVGLALAATLACETASPALASGVEEAENPAHADSFVIAQDYSCRTF